MKLSITNKIQTNMAHTSTEDLQSGKQTWQSPKIEDIAITGGPTPFINELEGWYHPNPTS